ncbi:MAG: GNAT family N-acetyltransferase [Alphaproteobacteria bacterium]|nr:GNAT family N-acetyltransferase [Alphaproteobacteria bacterium]
MTDLPPGLRQCALAPDDAERAVRLSDGAGWNQSLEDWRMMLTVGSGVGIEDEAGSLLASALILPYGAAVAAGAPPISWISMVLTAEPWRRRGLARRLMQDRMAELRSRGLMPVLDATPAGHAVYSKLGFRDGLMLERMQGDVPKVPEAPPGIEVSPLRDIADIAAADAAAFGTDRSAILSFVRAQAPDLAFVARHGGRLAGHVLVRRGRRMPHLGPVVADDAPVAVALLGAVLRSAPAGKPIIMDVFAHQSDFRAAAIAAGFVALRPFTRMHLGDQPPHADATRLFAAAGPELG